jgi:hypothetical protein
VELHSRGLELVEVSCRITGKRWHGVRRPRCRSVVSIVKPSNVSLFYRVEYSNPAANPAR